jgi:flavin-binding protein dodecin
VCRAIAKAHETRNIQWFEVVGTRGQRDGRRGVRNWQVTVKVGSRYSATRRFEYKAGQKSDGVGARA